MSEPASRDLFGTPVAPRPRGGQLPLPLGWRRAGAHTLVTGSSNRDAVDLVFRPEAWTSPAVILAGPKGSGKSLIAALFAGRRGTAIDCLEDADEEALFHLWNRAKESGRTILLVARTADPLTAVRLPDLATRLATAQRAEIAEPDACLARDLIEHLLAERGLAPAPQLGAYVAARIERSYAAIHAAVAAIDAGALAGGGGASVRSARDALINSGLYLPSASDGGAAS